MNPSAREHAASFAGLAPSYKAPTFQDSIVALFDSIKHPLNTTYTDASGKSFVLENQVVWTKPLGKKLLLVDIDTRAPTEDNQMFNPGTLDWSELGVDGAQLVSHAVLNHYMYAQIHGYDYKFIQAAHIEDHHDTWISPHVLHSHIPDYDFVVTMDADTTISHLEVPFEWMFNRWGITEQTSMSMPWDTVEATPDGGTYSNDSKGVLVLNTGFMVVQNANLTMEMLQAWKDCTTETRYPGCGRWKEEWSHEQRAFSEYIRYDFNPTGKNIVAIPCDEAMGWPGMLEDNENRITSNCSGQFIRHHTLKKNMAKTSGAETVMEALAQIVQKSLLSRKADVYVDEAATTLSLDTTEIDTTI
ncbi:hypothetical protein BDV95DRAFT_481826 [Massariosphaeria phaeospora]|uniref:Nucleotide-diphospho-sugar transferase domain-containing protein n=1 Tax=Massariosphaeria phaeospora TaxID=100035 RepID=A0A7C8IEJ5_9PLEO|nr:hypothetical protein BDV95DRAFT_481826 [Massariosphaeria phaeospora]